MSVKLIAMGNVLMKDDGIGIEVVKIIEENLTQKGIEVIYGETDFGYCLSRVKEGDFILIIDAACYGKNPGEVTVMALTDFVSTKKNDTQHSYSFLDLLKLYFPLAKGEIFAIEIHTVEFGFGLSSVLQEKLKDITYDILNKIAKVLKEIYFIE